MGGGQSDGGPRIPVTFLTRVVEGWARRCLQGREKKGSAEALFPDRKTTAEKS